MLLKSNGKSLIQKTYENACRCKRFNRLLVATDSREIFDHVKSFGGEAAMTSEACPSGSDRLAEAVEKDPSLQKAAAILNIQGDEPELHPETIEAVAEALLNEPAADMATAAVRIRSKKEAENPSCVKCVFDKAGFALYFSRAMIPFGKNGAYTEEAAYYKHLGIYAYRPIFLIRYAKLPPTPLQKSEDLEQLKALENGHRIKVVEVPHDSVGVDTHEDLKRLQ